MEPYGEPPILVARAIRHAVFSIRTAIGDATIGTRAWLSADPRSTAAIIAFALSLKMPYRQTTFQDFAFTRGSADDITSDQSIQAGRWRMALCSGDPGLSTGRSLIHAVFFRAYLFNPKGTNGVPTFALQKARIMSVSDQYLYRGGIFTRRAENSRPGCKFWRTHGKASPRT